MAAWILLAALVEGLIRAGTSPSRVNLVEDACRFAVILGAAWATRFRARRSPPALVPIWRALHLGVALFGLAT